MAEHTVPAASPAAAPERESFRPPRPYPRWYRALAKARRSLWALYWRARLAELGPGAWIDRPAYFFGHESIAIGAKSRIWRDVRLEAHRAGPGIVRIRIGVDTGLQPYVHIGAAESVEIGRRCRLAQGVYISDHDHDYDDLDDEENLGKRLIASPVKIGDFVWLGERVMVLKGVTIGDKTVVGAGSIVTKSLPPKVIAIGAPARVIRRWNDQTKRWEPAPGA
jgi:lipopolysaccharide O-acetyltransferase